MTTTTNTGKAFEQQFFALLKREVAAGSLGLAPKLCKVLLNNCYYSEARQGEIEIDVAVELWLPGAENWSLLWAWECKDYSGAVPVEDVEEFWAKLSQIAGVNVKGGIATTGALQKSALQFARSKGLAVVRILPGDQVQTVSYCRISDSRHRIVLLHPQSGSRTARMRELEDNALREWLETNTPDVLEYRDLAREQEVADEEYEKERLRRNEASRTMEKVRVESALTDRSFTSDYRRFYAVSGEQAFSTLGALIGSELRPITDHLRQVAGTSKTRAAKRMRLKTIWRILGRRSGGDS